MRKPAPATDRLRSPPPARSQVAALQGLGLNIRRARLMSTEAGGKHKFYITDRRESSAAHSRAAPVPSLWPARKQARLPNRPLCTFAAPGAYHNAVKSEKVVKSAKIEEIRLTILNNMLKYHPESAEQLAWGASARTARVRDTNPTSMLGARRK